MPDNTEETVVIHLTATLKYTPAQFAALLLRHEAEKHPAIMAELGHYEEVLATSAPKPPADPPPAAPQEPVEAPVDPPVEAPPPEPQPPAARAGRPPRANGKAAPAKAAEPAPEPEPDKPLEEADVRAVLRIFSANVPGRDTAVVKLLQEIGGAPRLADCDRETWPAIVAAAQQAIAANARPS